MTFQRTSSIKTDLVIAYAELVRKAGLRFTYLTNDNRNSFDVLVYGRFTCNQWSHNKASSGKHPKCTKLCPMTTILMWITKLIS